MGDEEALGALGGEFGTVAVGLTGAGRLRGGGEEDRAGAESACEGDQQGGEGARPMSHEVIVAIEDASLGPCGERLR